MFLPPGRTNKLNAGRYCRVSLYVGLFEMGLTYVLWLKALQLSSTTAKVSNLVYISPFLSLMFVSIAVGETIYFYTIAGLALIVGGIVLQRVVR